LQDAGLKVNADKSKFCPWNKVSCILDIF
jgi:hypothetical protein